MKIEEGMQFVVKDDEEVYTIYKIEKEKCWVNWKDSPSGVRYTIFQIERNLTQGDWKLILSERDELIEHELLDRASIVLDMFNNYIQIPAQEYGYLKDNAILAEIQEISEALHNLYQNLGNLDAGN